MLPDRKIRCHYTGFSKSCADMVSKHGCQKFVHLLGADPQTGNPIDKFGCSDAFMHMLTIENSKMARETGAAVESFRNEMAKTGAQLVAIAASPVRPRESGDLSLESRLRGTERIGGPT